MEKTREIPKGWHFLNENELIRGTFRHLFNTDINCIIHLNYDPKKDRDTPVELFKTNTPKPGAFYVINNKIYICITTGGDPTGKMLYMFSNPNSSSDDHIIDNLSEITLWEVRNKKPEQEHAEGYEFGTKTIESVSTEIDKTQIKLDMLKKELEGLKAKLYDLPEWLLVGVNGGLFINNSYFHISHGNWGKTIVQDSLPRFVSASLQECKYLELIVGDWYMENPKDGFILGFTEILQAKKVNLIRVIRDGCSADKKNQFEYNLEKLVYKIVKA